MANEIKAKLGTATAMTITLASLASSATFAGQQTTMVDNTTTLWQRIHLYVKVTTGTSPTANRGIYIYLIKGNKAASPDIITDGAGATNAALTVVAAQQIGGALTDATSNKAYQIDLLIDGPGPSWGVAIVHDTGVALNSTAGNHAVYYVGENPEVQ